MTASSKVSLFLPRLKDNHPIAVGKEYLTQWGWEGTALETYPGKTYFKILRKDNGAKVFVQKSQLVAEIE